MLPSAATIDKKAQHLFEKFCNCEAFSVFSDGAKPAIQPVENLDIVHIGHEQTQPSPSSQPVGCSFNTSDFGFILPVVFAMLAHRVLFLLGVSFLVVKLSVFNKHYNTLR